MADKPLPWFRFLARDWAADSRIKLLSFAAQGALVQLLCFQWINDGLPAQPDQLARLLGASPEEFNEFWPELQDLFEHGQDGLLVNRALAEEKEWALKRHERRVQAGKKGADNRWRGHLPASDRDSNANGPANSNAMASSRSRRERARDGNPLIRREPDRSGEEGAKGTKEGRLCPGCGEKWIRPPNKLCSACAIDDQTGSADEEDGPSSPDLPWE